MGNTEFHDRLQADMKYTFQHGDDCNKGDSILWFCHVCHFCHFCVLLPSIYIYIYGPYNALNHDFLGGGVPPSTNDYPLVI